MKRITLGTILFCFFIISHTYSDSRLIGLWSMNEEPDAIVLHDESGNGREAILDGDASIQEGLFGRAAYFPDTGRANGAATITLPALSNMTIAAWIYYTGATNKAPRIIDAPAFALVLNPLSSTTPIQFNINAATTGWWRPSFTGFTSNRWIHVAVTYGYVSTNSVPNFYIYGHRQELVSGALPSTPNFRAGTAVIGNVGGRARVLGGKIDDLRIYDRVLTDREINALAITRLPYTEPGQEPKSRRTLINGAFVHQKRADIVWTKILCKQPDRYIGWPTVCMGRNGTLFAVFSGDRDKHVCPWGKVQLVTSTDQGETWSAERIIGNTPLDDRDAGIVELPNGELLVTWFTSRAYEASIRDRSKLKADSPRFYWWLHDEKLSSATKKQWMGLFEVRSGDGGKTWTSPKSISGIRGTTPHGPVLLKDGRLLYFGRHFDKLTFITVAESIDLGKTWQHLADIVPLPEEHLPMMFHEPYAIETDDGRIVVQVRYHGKDNCLRQSESADGGKTWSVMKKTGMAGLPPYLIKLRDGKLVTVYGRRFGPGFGEYACISDDQGRTWDVANEIKLTGHFDGDLGYPTSVELKDGSILTVYYQADVKGDKPCLMGTRWRIK